MHGPDCPCEACCPARFALCRVELNERELEAGGRCYVDCAAARSPVGVRRGIKRRLQAAQAVEHAHCRRARCRRFTRGAA